MAKIKNVLLSEKIPGAVCALACMFSVFFGFGMGYVVFGMGEPAVAYASEADLYQAGMPHMAVMPELYELQTTENMYPPPNEEQMMTHLYVVTTLDGYIVIYHATENGGEIKELTSTSVCALAPEELERLNAGILIYTDEALARILQDYGS